MKKNQMYVAATGGLGGALFSLLFSDGDSYSSTIIGGVIGIGIVLLILGQSKKEEQNNIPERDERLDAMISKFTNYLSVITIGFIWIAVFVFYALGYQSIDLSLINGFLLLMLFSFLVGLSIIRRK